MSLEPSTLAARLDAAIVRHGRKRVAYLIGVSVVTVWKWRTSRRFPRAGVYRAHVERVLRHLEADAPVAAATTRR